MTTYEIADPATRQLRDSDSDWLPGPPWALARAKANKLTIFEKVALALLWSYSRSNGESWRAMTTIAAEMPANLKSARVAVHGLIAKGLVRREVTFGQPAHLFILPGAVTAYLQATPPELGTPVNDSPPELGRGVLPETGGGYTVNGRGTPPELGRQRLTINPDPITLIQDPDPFIPAAEKPPPSPRSTVLRRQETWGDTYPDQAAFTAAMIEQYRGVMSEPYIREQIESLMDHKNRRNYTRMDLYVGRNLARHARERQGASNAGTNRGNGASGSRPAGPGGGNSNRRQPSGGAFYDADDLDSFEPPSSRRV